MLNQDYKDIFLCLKNADVEFLVVGAYALAFYGMPRATGDIDIWINPTDENADRVIQALTEFGTPFQSLDKDDFNQPDRILQIGVAPCRIDIITSIDGVEFHQAWQNKVIANISGLALPTLSKKDLLTNKLAANRDKDQSDIRWLKKHLD